MFLYGFRGTLSDEGHVAEEMRQHHMTTDELDDYYYKEDQDEEDASLRRAVPCGLPEGWL